MAFSSQLLYKFPPFDLQTPWIDDALGRRALMLGEYMEIPDELVLYRIYDKNTSNDGLGTGKKLLSFIRQRWLDYFYALHAHYLNLASVFRIGWCLSLETLVCVLNMSRFYRYIRGRR